MRSKNAQGACRVHPALRALQHGKFDQLLFISCLNARGLETKDDYLKGVVVEKRLRNTDIYITFSVQEVSILLNLP